MTDFPALLRTLVDNRVEFIIIGGVAAAVHGSVRLTLDLDVVYSRSPENVARIVSALAPYRPYLRGAPPGLPFRWSEATIASGLNFTLTTAIGEIDLFGEIVGGGGYDQLLPQTVELELFGMECRALCLETLIQVKRAAGRPRDLETIAELETVLAERGELPAD